MCRRTTLSVFALASILSFLASIIFLSAPSALAQQTLGGITGTVSDSTGGAERNQTLSEQRVQTIASLLVNDLHVPQSAITHQVGHGNVDQPNPDPRSAANRVVVITYTVN